MKECEQIGDLFGELHDQQLDGAIEKAARAHLHDCPGCREEFKWYGITVQALTQLERVQPPEHFLDQLNARLQTCSPSYSFLDSFRNMFSFFPQLPVPVGVTALTFVVAVAWAVYTYPPAIGSIPLGTKTLVQASGGSLENAEASGGSSRWQAAPNTKLGSGVAPVAKGTPVAPVEGRSYQPPQPRAMAKGIYPANTLPDDSQTIGSEHLTVESPSINMAVESLKRVLPDLKGKLVEEKTRDGLDETVLAVMIPPQSWSNLTTELINHGAVAVGPDAEATSPQSRHHENSNVLIRIRIVNTH